MSQQSETNVSTLAVFQSIIYGNDALKLKEKKEMMKQADITDKITVRDQCDEIKDTSVTNIYNDDKEKVWGAHGDEDIWIIFDTHGYKINHIEMYFWQLNTDNGEQVIKYGCNMIHILQSNDLKSFQHVLYHKCIDNELNHHKIKLNNNSLKSSEKKK
eukprot:548451_1